MSFMVSDIYIFCVVLLVLYVCVVLSSVFGLFVCVWLLCNCCGWFLFANAGFQVLHFLV